MKKYRLKTSVGSDRSKKNLNRLKEVGDKQFTVELLACQKSKKLAIRQNISLVKANLESEFR